MLARNCLFIVVCLAGTGLVTNSLFRRQRVPQPTITTPTPEFQKSLAQLNAEFHDHWQSNDLEAAPHANDLTLARRLSLALVGAAPSLEEIRALEDAAPDRRLNWQLDHL